MYVCTHQNIAYSYVYIYTHIYAHIVHIYIYTCIRKMCAYLYTRIHTNVLTQWSFTSFTNFDARVAFSALLLLPQLVYGTGALQKAPEGVRGGIDGLSTKQCHRCLAPLRLLKVLQGETISPAVPDSLLRLVDAVGLVVLEPLVKHLRILSFGLQMVRAC